jgi:uncharacterized protein YdcH (DUF465 family)
VYLKTKYNKCKLKVGLVEKKRDIIRNSESWLEIRNLKKKKLALKDILMSQDKL